MSNNSTDTYQTIQDTSKSARTDKNILYKPNNSSYSGGYDAIQDTAPVKKHRGLHYEYLTPLMYAPVFYLSRLLFRDSNPRLNKNIWLFGITASLAHGAYLLNKSYYLEDEDDNVKN
ncbi:hypothetical protein DLAC_00388 [Tieghemostelium lacteum]|uniref:Transmembrane protein n=1 Tax=Tieghemostelium lacteum TaxID=361077 RepID=A0A152A9K9_TIELA|nr:hypothetical protein DLAC_00388 [Tieghemostelium lacteum]|eukprot:KYR02908.1 hypothetical protein DLAC_00388 [Tieghemostelium lacteum]